MKRIDRNKDDTDCCTDATDFDNAEYCCHSDAGGDELQAAPKLVKEYIKGSFKKLIGDTYIYEAVSAHLEYTEQRRVDFIIAGLTDFVNS